MHVHSQEGTNTTLFQNLFKIDVQQIDNYWIFFTIDVIKDYPYNYGRIIQML